MPGRDRDIPERYSSGGDPAAVKCFERMRAPIPPSCEARQGLMPRCHTKRAIFRTPLPLRWRARCSGTGADCSARRSGPFPRIPAQVATLPRVTIQNLRKDKTAKGQLRSNREKKKPKADKNKKKNTAPTSPFAARGQVRKVDAMILLTFRSHVNRATKA